MQGKLVTMSPGTRVPLTWVLLSLVLLTTACGRSSPVAPSSQPTSPPEVLVVVDPPPLVPVVPVPPVPALPPPPPAPTLAVTRILCFGDSLTAGYVAPTARVLLAAVADAYPTQLQLLLSRRYEGQVFTVENAGVFGEWADEGKDRIVSVVRASRPDVVVLMEGVNDINALGTGGVAVALDALENMLRDARALGVRVFLASLPPQRPGNLGAEPTRVNDLNRGIRDLATRQQVVFVDINRAFGGDLTLIGPDGLHPTAAGYQRMAQAVFDALRVNFER